MKNKLSNIIKVKLYLDALKQLKLIGFICLGILLIISVLIPVGSAIDMNQYSSISPRVITATRASFAMYLIFTIFTPILILYIFSFLTKRNACDYFHGFPQKRGCLFNTYFAATVTWIFILTFVTALVTGITYGILSKYFVFSYVNLFKYSLAIFLCSLLVAAAITLSCSITGTIFTNIVVTGLILFLPRFITAIAINIITSNLRMVVSSKILPLLDYSYNLVFNSVIMVFNGSRSSIYEIKGSIYTAILACIYIGVARLLFIRRKSETAGNPSANGILQCIIRISISIPICLIPLTYIFSVVIGKDSLNAPDLFNVIVFYIIAVIVMLLYELISTKKFKNVVRSIPSVGLLLIINVFILLMLVGLYQSILNFKPTKENVEYLLISNSTSNNEMDYFEAAMSTKKITNKELIELLVSNLSKNIEYEKTSYPGYSMTGSALMNYAKVPSYKYITVGFKSGLTVKYRSLYLETQTYNEYISLLGSSNDAKEVYMNLPNYNKNLMTFNSGLSEIENKDIYNTLKDEVKTLDYNQWYSLLYDNYNTIKIRWNYNLNDTTTQTVLPLTYDTPKALLKYIQAVNSVTDAQKVKEDLKHVLDNDSRYNVTIQGFYSDFTQNMDVISRGNLGVMNIDREEDKLFIEKLYKSLDTNSLALTNSISQKNMILVNLDIYLKNGDDNSKGKNNSYSIYAFFDKTVLNDLKMLQ